MQTTVAVCFTALAYFVLRVLNSRRSRFPPGPPGKPLIANLFDMPTKNEWLVFGEWAKTYGDIMSIRILGRTIVILNAAQDVRELLIARGTQYSGRMYFTLAELAGWGNSIGTTQPGARFRIFKRFATKTMGAATVTHLAAMADDEVTACLRRLIRLQPDDPRAQLKRMTSSVILRLAYGYEVKSDDDRFVDLSEAALDTFFKSTAPGWVVDAFPILRYIPAWMPGAGFKRQAAQWRKIVEDSRYTTMNWTKAQMEAGTAVPSLAADLLAEPDNFDMLATLIADLYGAGSDTTLSASATLFLTLALHPGVQARAQREIDAVTLGERLPTYEDRERLPFVDAIVKEVYRFRGVANIGVPHRALSREEYKGYDIPQGAVIIPNIWSILHNPDKYPEPWSFKPERYLDPEEGLRLDDGEETVNEDPTRYVFGFGPRLCPGRYLADATVFLLAAKTLATCDIGRAADEQGKPLTPDAVQYMPGIVSHPAPYQCKIKPRSSRAEALLFDGLA